MKFFFSTDLTTAIRGHERWTRIALGGVVILFKDRSPVSVSCGEEVFETTAAGPNVHSPVSYQMLLYHMNRLLALQGNEIAMSQTMKEFNLEN